MANGGVGERDNPILPGTGRGTAAKRWWRGRAASDVLCGQPPPSGLTPCHLPVPGRIGKAKSPADQWVDGASLIEGRGGVPLSPECYRQ